MTEGLFAVVDQGGCHVASDLAEGNGGHIMQAQLYQGNAGSCEWSERSVCISTAWLASSKKKPTRL